MARITCAISGLTFSCEHISMSLAHTQGYYHPIFALPYKDLYPLYTKHCQGELIPTDSYLLFLAFIHNTDQVIWAHPATCLIKKDSTLALVENNIAQLIRVIEQTNIITLPSFSQPSYIVRKDTSLLTQIPNWIAAWEANVKDFRLGITLKKERDDLQRVENKLTILINGGTNTKNYTAVIANWACNAAEFPNHKAEKWCRIIRSCFNTDKMFATPITEIREIKLYCEENIQAGSIHFHKLMEVLRECSTRNTAFLGYSLLPEDIKNKSIELEAIATKAPTLEPKREDYPKLSDFIRDKLRYKLATKK